jgi:hypothetical protein
MYNILGGIAAVMLVATTVPGIAEPLLRAPGIQSQVIDEGFSAPRRHYRRYQARRYGVGRLYLSSYYPYFYYTPLHYYAPPPGIRYYGPRFRVWW